MSFKARLKDLGLRLREVETGHDIKLFAGTWMLSNHNQEVMSRLLRDVKHCVLNLRATDFS